MQGVNDKNPKISRTKAKKINFEASKYGTKKVKNLDFLEKFSTFVLE